MKDLHKDIHTGWLFFRYACTSLNAEPSTADASPRQIGIASGWALPVGPVILEPNIRYITVASVGDVM